MSGLQNKLAALAHWQWRPPLSLRPMDVMLYRLCEVLTEPLVYFMVIMGPWVYGTTLPVVIQFMSGVGYTAGVMLAMKCFIRWFKGYRPPRWNTVTLAAPPTVASAERVRHHRRSLLDRCLPTLPNIMRMAAVATILILLYCLVSALNARSTCVDVTGFEYHKHISWLPHSFDSIRSWKSFWMYLGLACAFWSVCDWLSGKTDHDLTRERARAAEGITQPARPFPDRIRRLLWVLCINGGLLGIQAIAQRASGTSKLLWLVQSANPEHREPVHFFGTYAYRSNAAQYFNLLWPVCLGFWWTLHEHYGARRRRQHWLLLSAAIMAACPIISTSRGGAIISISMLVVILVLAPFFIRRSKIASDDFEAEQMARRKSRSLVFAFLVASLGIGLLFGWDNLSPRLEDLKGGYQGRQHLYNIARSIAADYPLYGTGPGTFAPLYQMYRFTFNEYWPGQLHNDWLETRITFGLVGCSFIAIALLAVLMRSFRPGGISPGWPFIGLVWMAMGGCMAHATMDYPFQIHSILFLFLVWCAVLMNVSSVRGAMKSA